MRFPQLLLLGMLMVFPLAARADDTTSAEKYDPAKTKIAILPLVNKAAEFSANFRDKTKDKAEKSITERFTSRGFQLVDSTQVVKCLEESKLDVNERENWQPDKILAIGKQLNARLVLLCVILDAHSKDNNNVLFGGSIFGGSKEGFASVRAYLVDTSSGASVLKGERTKGKSTSGAFSSFDKGMDRQTTAVLKGFDAALKEFLIQYPVLNNQKK